MNLYNETKGKIGDIIYPAYNGTNGFWQRPRWDLVTKVDKKGNITDRRYIWDLATVKAIELIQDLYVLRLRKELKEKDMEIKKLNEVRKDETRR